MKMGITYKNKLVACLLLLIAGRAFAQPVNDECANAATLPIVTYGSCAGGTIGDTGSATDSGVPPSCDPTTVGYQDVWYVFNTGSNTSIDITLTPITSEDWNYAVYDACFGAELVCFTVPTTTETFTVDAGTDFWIMVESNLQYGNGGTFSLCIEGVTGSTGTPPPNDDCSAAVLLAVNANCTPTSGTVNQATESFPASPCASEGDANDDVWYRFVAPSTNVVVGLDVSGDMDGKIEVFPGSCGNLTTIACSDDGSSGEDEVCQVTGLIVGNTYSFRVFDRNSFYPASSNFSVCVYLPPANDECSAAQVLPMLATCIPVNTDAENATESGVFTTCGPGQSDDDDVWYAFVATGGDVRITIDGGGTGANGYDPVARLLFGTNCNTFNELACADATSGGGSEVLEFFGVNPGNTYYVQVYDAGTGIPGNTGFTICVQDISSTVGVPVPSLVCANWSIGVISGSSTLQINGSVGMEGKINWRMLDAAGRLLATSNITLAGQTEHLLTIPSLVPGMYSFLLEVNNGYRMKRFVVE